jgi:D-alanyl-D-alanine carboxypeptidase/D-alanyl-D-alanine-endopeptidase (penicillin-binding protein 4)
MAGFRARAVVSTQAMTRTLISTLSILALAGGGCGGEEMAPRAASPAQALTRSSAAREIAVDPGREDLVADLDAILADPRLRGGQAAVLVRSAETGEVLYERDADRRLMPASNEKLFTSAVALDILGADYTFATAVATQANLSGCTLLGDIYLRGTGDPTMLAGDYGQLADQVAGAGIRVVTGRLVADDTWFDAVRLGNDWSWDDEPFYYAAQVSALTVAPDTDYDAGTVIVEVRPGAGVGDPVQIGLVPVTGHVTIVNRATTAAAGSGDAIAIEREHGGNRILVTGSLAVDRSLSRDWASVAEPTAYAADVFRLALESRGVRVVGPTAYGATPADARLLAEHRSAPLAAILTPFLKLSNNGHAEVLIKSIGRRVAGEGSWSAGLAALRDHLDSYGVDAAAIASRDGSGLSRRNLVPPRQIAALLDAAEERPWFGVWYDALPIAGQSDRMVGGTLRSRMRGTPAAGNLHGKTGTLSGASSLSGYVTDADGHRLIFSIMFNDFLSGKPSDLEDRIAVRLATHSEDPEAVAVGQDEAVQPPPVQLPDEVECSWVKGC